MNRNLVEFRYIDMRSFIFFIILVLSSFTTYGQVVYTYDETILVGHWQIIDYLDTKMRNDSENNEYRAAVENFKRMTLTLNKDKSYSRQLDQQSELGFWWLSDDKRKFMTKPTTQNAPKMEMNIEWYNKDKFMLIIVEAEKLDSFSVRTRLTFGRIK